MDDFPEDASTPIVDELVANNVRFAEATGGAVGTSPPKRHLVIVTCMDSRLDVTEVLGLERGDAHILRNAGGVVTDDVIRSLTLSQRALGTEEIILVHHTRCGLMGVTEEAFGADLEAEVGVRPEWSVEGFADVHDDVRTSIARLKASPFLRHKEHISGFVYDVDTGLLDPVD